MKRACVTIFFLMGSGLCVAQDALSLLRGKQLYRGVVSFSTAPTIQNVAMPANVTACASCHGLSGQGGREAGTVSPPIHANALLLPRLGGSAFNSLREALKGLDQGLGRLHAHGRTTLAPNMPRYRFSNQELEDLSAYVAVIGTRSDNPVGVSENRIRVAAMLPVQGAMQLAGREVEAGLRSEIRTINDRGGIYGRYLDLLVQPLHGQSAVVYRQALAELSQKDVYAVVGAWQPPYDAALPNAIPMVGSLGFAATQAQSRVQVFLLPSLQDQLNDLFRHVEEQCGTVGDPLVVVHNDHTAVNEALTHTNFLQRSDAKIIKEKSGNLLQVDAGSYAAQRLVSLGVSVSAAKPSMAKPICLAQLAALSGMPPNGIAIADKQLTLLPVPQSLTQTGDTPFWTLMGSMAARLLGDALSRSGRQLDEQSLQRTFESVDKFDLASDVSVGYSKKTVPGLRSTLMTSGGSYVSYSN
jgi:cytochrome c553